MKFLGISFKDLKMVVVYKSKSKNTEKIAKSIAKTLNIHCIQNIRKKLNSNIVFYGFWVDKSKPCKAIYKDFRYLKDKKVILFFTLGSEKLEYQEKLKNNFKALFDNVANVIAIECFQGSISFNLLKKSIKKRSKIFYKERLKRFYDTRNYPNENEINKANDFALEAIKYA